MSERKEAHHLLRHDLASRSLDQVGAVDTEESSMLRTRKLAPFVAIFMVMSVVIGATGVRPVVASGVHQTGGTLTVAYEQPPDTLNPATTGETSVWVMIRNIFDCLTYLDKNGNVTPWLASSW